MKGLLVILTGPSGSGKDTIRTELFKKYPQAIRVVTITTRAPREGEINGINYYFVDQETFQKMQEEGRFLETVEYSGNFYGTTKQALEEVLDGKTAFWVMDVSGASKVKAVIKSFFDPDKAGQLLDKMFIIYLDTPNNHLIERLTKRGDSPESIRKRLIQDAQARNLKDQFENIVENKNGDLEKTVNKICEKLNSYVMEH